MFRRSSVGGGGCFIRLAPSLLAVTEAVRHDSWRTPDTSAHVATRLRHHRKLSDLGAGRPRREDRVVLHAAFRCAVCFCIVTGSQSAAGSGASKPRPRPSSRRDATDIICATRTCWSRAVTSVGRKRSSRSSISCRASRRAHRLLQTDPDHAHRAAGAGACPRDRGAHAGRASNTARTSRAW